MLAIIRWMERAGALALFLIVVLMTTTTITRYFFQWPLPDGDAISRLLLAVAVFWGFAGACLHGEHIQLDLMVNALPPKIRKATLKLTGVIMLVAVGTTTWMSAYRVIDLIKSGEKTYDLGMPLWPLYAVAFLGLVAATIVLAALLLGRSSATPTHSDLEAHSHDL